MLSFMGPGTTRGLALQGSMPQGEEKSICSSQRCDNSFWLLLSASQGQGKLKEPLEGQQGSHGALVQQHSSPQLLGPRRAGHITLPGARGDRERGWFPPRSLPLRG